MNCSFRANNWARAVKTTRALRSKIQPIGNRTPVVYGMTAVAGEESVLSTPFVSTAVTT